MRQKIYFSQTYRTVFKASIEDMWKTGNDVNTALRKFQENLQKARAIVDEKRK